MAQSRPPNLPLEAREIYGGGGNCAIGRKPVVTHRNHIRRLVRDNPVNGCADFGLHCGLIARHAVARDDGDFRPMERAVAAEICMMPFGPEGLSARRRRPNFRDRRWLRSGSRRQSAARTRGLEKACSFALPVIRFAPGNACGIAQNAEGLRIRSSARHGEREDPREISSRSMPMPETRWCGSK